MPGGFSHIASRRFSRTNASNTNRSNRTTRRTTRYSYSITGNQLLDGSVYLFVGIIAITGVLVYGFYFNYSGLNWLFILIAVLAFSGCCIYPGIKILIFQYCLNDCQIGAAQSGQNGSANSNNQTNSQTGQSSQTNNTIFTINPSNINLAYNPEPPSFEEVLRDFNDSSQTEKSEKSTVTEILPNYRQSIQIEEDLNIQLPDYCGDGNHDINDGNSTDFSKENE